MPVSHNYKRMEKRRVSFTLGVVYNTTPEKVQRIPGLIKDIILAQDTTTFDRAHFSAFGQFSLTFEVVYYILAPDYNLYMDRQQAIYLAILNAFKREGIQFALPTQTLQFSNGNMPFAGTEAKKLKRFPYCRTNSPSINGFLITLNSVNKLIQVVRTLRSIRFLPCLRLLGEYIFTVVPSLSVFLD